MLEVVVDHEEHGEQNRQVMHQLRTTQLRTVECNAAQSDRDKTSGVDDWVTSWSVRTQHGQHDDDADQRVRQAAQGIHRLGEPTVSECLAICLAELAKHGAGQRATRHHPAVAAAARRSAARTP